MSYYAEFAYHKTESEPELVKRIIDSARYEQIRDAWLLGKKYVETNNRITFFCHALADLFPRSTFIHLVRKPEEFITSGLARNWYSGSVLHDEGRITPEGEELNQVEKIAWLWNETNTFIENFKQLQPDNRVITVRSEELFHSADTSVRILEFLHLEIPNRKILQKQIATPVNKQSKKTVDKSQVTSDLLEEFAPLRERYF